MQPEPEPGQSHESKADSASDPRTAPDGGAFDGLIPDLVSLVNMMLGVGATLTRMVAQASEPGRTDTGPVDEIVRNGASAISNLVRMTVGTLRAGTAPPATPTQRSART